MHENWKESWKVLGKSWIKLYYCIVLWIFYWNQHEWHNFFFTFLEVVIEEIPDDDQPENGDGLSKPLKKKEKDNKSSQLAIRDGNNLLALESEDEDGFPISTAEKGKSESHKVEAETKGEQEDKKTRKDNKKEKDVDHSASLKRKVGSADDDEDELLQDG